MRSIILFTFAVLLAGAANVSAQKTYELASPDGKLKTTVSIGDQIT